MSSRRSKLTAGIRCANVALIVGSSMQPSRDSSRSPASPGTTSLPAPEQRAKTGRNPMKYLVVVEQNDTGFSAYSPDVPGCVATGTTRQDVEREMKKAIAFHLEGLQAEGIEAPAPHTFW